MDFLNYRLELLNEYLNQDNSNLQDYNPNIIKDIIPYDFIHDKKHYSLLNKEEEEENVQENTNMNRNPKKESFIISNHFIFIY